VRRLRHTTGWRVSDKTVAAEVLGLNPKPLESMMKKLGIQRSKESLIYQETPDISEVGTFLNMILSL
jgi:hypothetical protein